MQFDKNSMQFDDQADNRVEFHNESKMSKQEQNAIVDNYIADNLGQEEEDDDRKYIDDGKGNPKQIKGRYGQPINLKDRNDAINGSRQNDGPS